MSALVELYIRYDVEKVQLWYVGQDGTVSQVRVNRTSHPEIYEINGKAAVNGYDIFQDESHALHQALDRARQHSEDAAQRVAAIINRLAALNG